MATQKDKVIALLDEWEKERGGVSHDQRIAYLLGYYKAVEIAQKFINKHDVLLGGDMIQELLYVKDDAELQPAESETA